MVLFWRFWMKYSRIFILVISFALIITITGAAEYDDWKQVTVQESSANSSSNVTFTVMIPPDYSETVTDFPAGPITVLTNESQPDSLISIAIIPNPTGRS